MLLTLLLWLLLMMRWSGLLLLAQDLVGSRCREVQGLHGGLATRGAGCPSLQGHQLLLLSVNGRRLLHLVREGAGIPIHTICYWICHHPSLLLLEAH